MKKTLIILPFVAALLFLGYGCDGFKKEKKSDTPIETPRADDKGIAFEIFEHIPKEDLEQRFQTMTFTCPDSCRRHFGFNEGKDSGPEVYMEGGNFLFNVDCFPLKNGGWLALLVNEGCFDGCDQEVKTYIYKDGVLNVANGMLPMPAMEEMVAYPFLLYGVNDDEINHFKSEWNDRLLYNVQGDDTLKVDVETLNYDDQFMSVLSERKYVWNGESFVPILNNETRTYPLIDMGALGGLHLNDSMPEELPGLSRRYEGEAVVFNRDGEPFVKLHPDGAGKIQSIDVYAKDLTYYRGKIGDTLSRLLYKGGVENKAYYKNGEFVVTEEREFTENRIDYVGPNDAIDGSFVEGEIANPKFKPDATVQYIRIYKPHHWENDTCDMRALREALSDASLVAGNADYGINDFHYLVERYNDSCQGYCDVYETFIHCYPLKSGGFKVYETGNWQPGWEIENNPQEGFTLISAYIYKNGELTEVEPEPGLNDFELNADEVHFANVTDIEFDDRTIKIHFVDANNERQYYEFTWDGTAMRKTFEGFGGF